MNEKRFEVSFDEKRIFDIYAVNKNTTEYDIHKSCDLINSLYEENEQLEQKIKDKNEYQRVLEAKIRRLKDRIKVLEK